MFTVVLFNGGYVRNAIILPAAPAGASDLAALLVVVAYRFSFYLDEEACRDRSDFEIDFTRRVEDFLSTLQVAPKDSTQMEFHGFSEEGVRNQYGALCRNCPTWSRSAKPRPRRDRGEVLSFDDIDELTYAFACIIAHTGYRNAMRYQETLSVLRRNVVVWYLTNLGYRLPIGPWPHEDWTAHRCWPWLAGFDGARSDEVGAVLSHRVRRMSA